MTDDYTGAKKYLVPMRENIDGTRELLFPALGVVSLHPDEQVLMLFSPDRPHAFIYTYCDLKEILPWLQADQKKRSDTPNLATAKHKNRAPETLHDE